MTVVLSGKEISEKLAARFPGAVVDTAATSVVVKSESLLEIAGYLKNSRELYFNLLVDITAVDYWDYFELVYRFTSIEHNQGLSLKVRLSDREKPRVSSITGLWKGADLMEREVFDLMGILFEGHPNMKRIFLWEGFSGYPLRKDYL